MRIVCISDTHRNHRNINVPDGDVLVHAGDIGLEKCHPGLVSDFNGWLGNLPHKHKIIIPGNHDYYIERFPKEVREQLTNCNLLIDQSIMVKGIKFYGSPWQPEFFNWSFNLPRGERLKKVWDNIPSSTDILITHGPPAGILDKTYDGLSVGCKDLLERIDALKLKAHISGHIHFSYGSVKIGDTTFVNASLCDDRNILINEPIVIDI